MTDDPVSLDKAASGARATRGRDAGQGTRPGRGSRPGSPKANLAADGSPMPPPPKTARYAVIALGVSAVTAVGASLSLYGSKDWLFRSLRDSNPKPGNKGHKTVAQLHHAVSTTPTTSLVSTLVLLVALGLAARGVWRGRYWSRWTVIVLWVLATFTSTMASFIHLIGVASDEPIALKVFSFVSALALIAAVALVSIKPSAEYFALTRPPRPDGAPARRGGLFGGPRPARPARPAAGAARGTSATTRPARTQPAAGRDSAAARSRTKQRTTSESVAKGAELARARAKASKSRRTGV